MHKDKKRNENEDDDDDADADDDDETKISKKKSCLNSNVVFLELLVLYLVIVC